MHFVDSKDEAIQRERKLCSVWRGQELLSNSMINHLLARHLCRLCQLNKEMSHMHPSQSQTDCPITAKERCPLWPLGRDHCWYFTHNNKEYLLISDAFSKYLFLLKISCKTTKTTQGKFQQIVSQYRPPKHLYTDSGPNSTQKVFAIFLKLSMYSTEPHHPCTHN